MNVEFTSSILAGAAGTAHAERLLAPAGSGRGAAASPRAAEGVEGPLEAGDRDGDGRQPRGAAADSLITGDGSESSAPADSAARGQRLDLIA